MLMPPTGQSRDTSAGKRIILEKEDNWWVIRDEETGVTTQGETREHALEMLDDAVALYKGQAGRPVTEEDLREWGIDPEKVPDEPAVPDAAWFDETEWRVSPPYTGEELAKVHEIPAGRPHRESSQTPLNPSNHRRGSERFDSDEW